MHGLPFMRKEQTSLASVDGGTRKDGREQRHFHAGGRSPLWVHIRYCNVV